MSGGHFDYAQYRINDIIDSIDREIERATCERPKLISERRVNVYEYTSERSIIVSWRWHFNSFDSALDFFKRSCAFEILEICEKATRKVLRVRDLNDNRIFEIVEFEYEYYEDGNYYPDYDERTIEEFRKGIVALRKAQIYAQRIDWLLSGDDGEDSFHERLKEELSELNKE